MLAHGVVPFVVALFTQPGCRPVLSIVEDMLRRPVVQLHAFVPTAPLAWRHVNGVISQDRQVVNVTGAQ
jgi:hypothetical protein